MSRVFICSPFRGDYEGNSRRARRYCRLAFEMGNTPFAPHLLFPQFLDDTNPWERGEGITMGLQELVRCEEIWIFGRPTEGMAIEISFAQSMGISARYFDPDTLEERREAFAS